jgi:hypothetical protein
MICKQYVLPKQRPGKYSFDIPGIKPGTAVKYLKENDCNQPSKVAS